MHLKLQSAIEYLLSYGWALLTVAIVIIAMFQLGFLATQVSLRILLLVPVRPFTMLLEAALQVSAIAQYHSMLPSSVRITIVK